MARKNPNDTNAPTAFFGNLQPVEEAVEQLESPQPVQEAEHEGGAPVPATTSFRPRNRPPLPLLLVHDDGQRSAETIRIRKSPFRIGRVDGDLTLPLDTQLSKSHAELYVRQVNGLFVWNLKDLGSTNGTFVRVSEIVLKPGQVLLIGDGRFRFDEGSQCEEAAPEQVDHTQKWSVSESSHDDTSPCLVQLDQAIEVRLPLEQGECWLGRDAEQCSIVVADPLVSPRHMRITRDKKGRWRAQCSKARNGLWAQIEDIPFEKGGAFQCGEQRFLFKLA